MRHVVGFDHMAKAVFDGVVIADSDDVKVVEGITYFPADSVDQSRLIETPTQSQCFWKGRASYFSVQSDNDVAVDAAFVYKKPWPLARRLVTNRVGFWRDVKVTR